MRLEIDHIVFACPSLDTGAQWLEDKIGARLASGGQHPEMGTHNRLLKLGERLYLELIAIDPSLPAPQRPRWFSLGDPHILGSPEAEPRFIAWVARCKGISAYSGRSSTPFGAVMEMSRGAFAWSIAVPQDGALLEEGIVPYLIEWHGENHPADMLPASGVSLKAFALRHPEPEKIGNMLGLMPFSQSPYETHIVKDMVPGIAVCFGTPNGDVRFSSQRHAQEGILAGHQAAGG